MSVDDVIAQRLRIHAAIKSTGSVSAAARALGVTRATLRHQIERLDVDTEAAKSKDEAGASDALAADLSAMAEALAAERARKVAKLPKRRGKLPDGGYTRVIIPDTHGSFIDEDAATALLNDIQVLKPAEIVMLGDHVDCGGFLAQHHTLGYVADAGYTYRDDLHAANTFLDYVQQAAAGAQIYYLEGNHEARVEKWCLTQTLRNGVDADMLAQALAPQHCLSLEARGITYVPGNVSDDTDRMGGALLLGKCWFTHGVSFAQNAAAVHARRFGAPVVFGHTHRIQSHGTAFVASGDICAWGVGCLCRLRRSYAHSAPHEWQHGYGVQFVMPDDSFQHVSVHIHKGQSLLEPLLNSLR